MLYDTGSVRLDMIGLHAGLALTWQHFTAARITRHSGILDLEQWHVGLARRQQQSSLVFQAGRQRKRREK